MLFFLVVLLAGCNKEKNIHPGWVSADIRSINNYIKENMDIYYLWQEFIPPNLDPNTESDPKDFYDKHLYKLEDKWSFITEDYEGLINSFSGINFSFGHNFKLYQLKDTEIVFGIVEYVVEGSPADLAGIKRGDIFNEVDGIQLTTANYLSLLFHKESYKLGFAEYINGELIPLDKTIDLVAQQFQENPIYLDTVYQINGKNIGYFVYNQFISDFNQGLHNIFAKFKSEGVTDLVVDLRYNPGGSIGTANLLASLIAPGDQVNNEAVFSRYIWNDLIEQYWLDQQGPDSENLMIKFIPSANNINLDKVYFLVTNNSASASETTINGLIPYMEVVLIGETTSGKYTGSITLHDEDRSFTWAIQPIVLKTANANGNTEFKEGFAPDYLVMDDLFSPLGDLEEDMLAEAVSLITGIPVDQLARKAFPEILLTSTPLISGGFEPSERKKILRIDNISIQ